MEGNVRHVVKEVSKFDGKNADDVLERSSKLCVSLSLYSKPIFEIVQGSQWPSSLDNDQVTARESWDDTNHNLFSILFFMTSGPAFSVVRRFEGKTREDGSRAWTRGTSRDHSHRQRKEDTGSSASSQMTIRA